MLLTRLWRDLQVAWRMPRLTADLMYRKARTNHPFYAQITREFHREVRRRHPTLPLFRAFEFGVALCPLPATFDEYFMRVKGSARRNYKKAVREGCTFRPIEFNDHLGEITEIRRSAQVRQGRTMPESYLRAVGPIADPPPTDPHHGYPYFGVFREGRLLAYAGCFVCGEVATLAQIIGHADHLSLGAVPMLILDIARYLSDHHPAVRYYVYGKYFGAGETLRRFKLKFGFIPHRVNWQLGE